MGLSEGPGISISEKASTEPEETPAWTSHSPEIWSPADTQEVSAQPNLTSGSAWPFLLPFGLTWSKQLRRPGRRLHRVLRTSGRARQRRQRAPEGPAPSTAAPMCSVW